MKRVFLLGGNIACYSRLDSSFSDRNDDLTPPYLVPPPYIRCRGGGAQPHLQHQRLQAKIERVETGGN